MATSGAEEGPTPEEAPTETQRGSDNTSAGDGLAVDAGACPAAGSASASDAGGAPLSKNQQKKLAKRARFVEQRTARKAIRKERRKEQREQRMQHVAAEGGEVGEGGEGGPPEKKQRHEEGPRAKDWVGRQGGRGSRSREAFDEERKKGQRVVVDLGFDSLMTEREVRSLVTQVAHLYGCNRKSAKPLHLHLTSVGQRCEEGLRNISGFDNWKCEMETRNLSELFSKDEIVYLTAESPTVLSRLEQGHVYVIGGIVDHNRIKGHCHAQALKAGWKTAKLPLDGNVAMGDNRKVLTVNHVFEILLRFQETGSWAEAMGGALPQRKTKNFEQPALAAGSGGDSGGKSDSVASAGSTQPLAGDVSKVPQGRGEADDATDAIADIGSNGSGQGPSKEASGSSEAKAEAE